MSFIFPQFLWALAALAIPIVIHLFNFRRTTRVYFSDNRFLKYIKKEITPKRRLKRYLILVSRMLFIFFLVMAFAQPFLPSRENMKDTRDVMIYLDNSFSMSVQTPQKIRALDAGIEYIREIIKAFPRDTRYKLLTNDFAPFSNTFKTADEILDILTQIGLSAVTRTAKEVRNRMEPDIPEANIFWCSDFQKSTFLPDEHFIADSMRQWHPIPLAFDPWSNVYIDSVYLENSFLIGGEKNKIKVKLKSMGNEKQENLTVKLIINDVQTGVASIELEPDRFVEVSFDLGSHLSGLNKAKITVVDFPVTFDNDFYVTLNFMEKVEIIEIKENPDNTYVENVFGDHKWFSFKTFWLDNVDYSSLNQADLIVLNGLSSMDDLLHSALKEVLEDNRMVLLIPNENPNLPLYKKFVQGAALRTTTSTNRDVLDVPNTRNPFFENVFAKPSASMIMPYAVKVLDWGTDPSPILRFKNGSPFVSRKNTVFLMASPLKKGYTDFYNHALFVPVMYRIAASAKRTEKKIYYTLTDDLIAIDINKNSKGAGLIRLVGDQERIPTQRSVEDKVLLEFPKFSMNPGFYSACRGYDTLNIVAMNLDKRESYLNQYGLDEIQSFFGQEDNKTILNTAGLNSFSDEIKDRYLKKILWKEALVLALLCLFAETLFIRYMK